MHKLLRESLIYQLTGEIPGTDIRSWSKTSVRGKQLQKPCAQQQHNVGQGVLCYGASVMPYGRDASKEVSFTSVITCHFMPQALEDSDTKKS